MTTIFSYFSIFISHLLILKMFLFWGQEGLLLLFLPRFSTFFPKNVNWQKVSPTLGSLRVERSNNLVLLLLQINDGRRVYRAPSLSRNDDGFWSFCRPPLVNSCFPLHVCLYFIKVYWHHMCPLSSLGGLTLLLPHSGPTTDYNIDSNDIRTTTLKAAALS